MVVNMGDENDFNDRGQWPAFYKPIVLDKTTIGPVAHT